MHDDIYNLKIGDIFMEDCYPEKYQIVRIQEKTDKCKMRLVIARNLDSGEDSAWGYTIPAYAPCIIKVN